MASADITIDEHFATIEVDGTERTVTIAKPGLKQFLVHNIGDEPATLSIGTVTITDPASPSQVDGDLVVAAGEARLLPRGLEKFKHRNGGTATFLTLSNVA